MTICGRTDSCDDPRDEMGCEDWLWCHLIRAVERPRHGGTEAVNLWEGGLLPGAWILFVAIRKAKSLACSASIVPFKAPT
jgi:hypothetical protein